MAAGGSQHEGEMSRALRRCVRRLIPCCALARVLLSLLLLSSIDIAVSQPAAPPLPGGESVEEVIVRAKSLNRLQSEVFRAEAAFYGAFNALNADHEFDIHCGLEAQIGSHLQQRVCRAKFVSTLRAQATQAALRGEPPPPTAGLMQEKAKLLKDQMRTAATQNPDLATALITLVDARKAFEAERKRRCEGRLFFCRRHD